MFYLHSGMIVSGTAWHFNLMNDLVVAAGHQDIHDLVGVYPRALARVVGGTSHHDIFRPNPFKMGMLEWVSRQGNTFAVKTHSPPGPSVRNLVARGALRCVYIYRDPRDVALGAFERGERNRKRGSAKRSVWRLGQYKSFARFTTIELAIRHVERVMIPRWEAWSTAPGTHLVRYEDMMSDPLAELRKLADFLELDVSDEAIAGVDAHYRDEDVRRTMKGMHFQKGVVGRHGEAMTKDQLAMCERAFGPVLERMGYTP